MMVSIKFKKKKKITGRYLFIIISDIEYFMFIRVCARISRFTYKRTLERRVT